MAEEAKEFNITINHTTSGKEVVLAVEQEFTVASILEVLAENLQLKDRFVLATKDNKILNPELTVKDAGIQEGDTLLLMPDPTGG
jgi:molybdopterin converting factor small subunit